MNIQRINGGRPVIAATNSCALLLEMNSGNDSIIEKILGKQLMRDRRIHDGVVVSLYTYTGKCENNMKAKKHSGLAVFTPEMELLKRTDDPVICASENPEDIDSAARRCKTFKDRGYILCMVLRV